jgi:hypothetical protein
MLDSNEFAWLHAHHCPLAPDRFDPPVPRRRATQCMSGTIVPHDSGRIVAAPRGVVAVESLMMA